MNTNEQSDKDGIFAVLKTPAAPLKPIPEIVARKLSFDNAWWFIAEAREVDMKPDYMIIRDKTPPTGVNLKARWSFLCRDVKHYYYFKIPPTGVNLKARWSFLCRDVKHYLGKVK